VITALGAFMASLTYLLSTSPFAPSSGPSRTTLGPAGRGSYRVYSMVVGSLLAPPTAKVSPTSTKVDLSLRCCTHAVKWVKTRREACCRIRTSTARAEHDERTDLAL